MDLAQNIAAIKIRTWLPYWAVLQEDVRQTLHSWVYRCWILLSLLCALAYLVYRVGLDREAGMVQHASIIISDLLRWSLLTSATLIIVLTAGSISSERGTIADSVLSRGISRYQYFLGKWHARLFLVLLSFLAVGIIALTGSFFFLHGDVHWFGSMIGLFAVAALLAVVITCGVTVSAVFNNTLLVIAIVWLLVYGAGFGLSLLPQHLPSPHAILNSLPYILRGEYNFPALGRIIGWSAIVCAGIASVGIGFFSRRDV